LSTAARKICNQPLQVKDDLAVASLEVFSAIVVDEHERAGLLVLHDIVAELQKLLSVVRVAVPVTAREPLDYEPLKQLAVAIPPLGLGDLHERCSQDRAEHKLESVVGGELCVEIGGGNQRQRLELDKQSAQDDPACS
jgi:hypothetical protein